MTQTLYFGGDILTLAQPFYAEAVLCENGKIAAVGTLERLKKSAPDARLYDLKGATLLPAFIDPHSHLTALANTLGIAALDGAKNFADMADRLKTFQREQGSPAGAFIAGFGYDHNILEEKRHPTRRDLDAAFPDTPVMVTHLSGHMGVANSCALALAGIGADTPDPEGGIIGREEDGKTPNGYLEENAFFSVGRLVPPPDEAQRLRALQRAQEIYLENGIATVQDGLLKEEELALLKTAAEKGLFKVDVVGYLDVKNAVAAPAEPYDKGYRNHFRIGGYKLFLDGSPQGRTAWMSEPYEGEQGYRGYPIYEDGQAEKLIARALEKDRQLLTHCNGDAAAEQLIRCYGRVKKQMNSTRDLRPVMIHAQLVRDDQLDRMKELGMMPSFFVAHVRCWGDTHIKNFGFQRAAHISPLKAALDKGLPFTLHQDTPVLPPNMLDTLQCAVHRVTAAGVPLGPEQEISVTDALKAVTIGAAYQYHEEREKGTIEVGKQADFAVLSANPVNVPKEDIGSIRVLATIKNDREIYRR